VDVDGSGVQPDEADGFVPVAGVEVRLLDADGEEVVSTTTGADGCYVFTDLEPSTEYVVQFPTTVVVDGVELSLTAQGAGSDTSVDSDPDAATGQVRVTTPAAGENL